MANLLTFFTSLANLNPTDDDFTPGSTRIRLLE